MIRGTRSSATFADVASVCVTPIRKTPDDITAVIATGLGGDGVSIADGNGVVVDNGGVVCVSCCLVLP